jgi:hypothetical protein
LVDEPPEPRCTWPTQTFLVTDGMRSWALSVWLPASVQSAALPFAFISRSSDRA